MDNNDKQAIDSLFGKLAQVEHQAAPRDPEAERFIAERISHQPGAPYFMAQTIVIQEQALNAAQARIEELEYQARQAPQGGGLLSRMFGGGGVPAPAPTPRRPPAQGHAPQGSGAAASPFQSGGRQMPGQGGGFLAGAAQTAMGVAGGVLLGNAVMGMFADQAEAAPPPAEEIEEPQDDFADEGGWDEE